MAKNENRKTPVRYAMVIDLDKCTGCMACAVACQEENNISFLKDDSVKTRSINWMRIFKLENGKKYPEHRYAFLPRPCMHCDSPHHSPCTFVCPVNATQRDEETGIVNQVYPRCIGCRYCMAACPYYARNFNWWDPTWPKDMVNMLNPDVSTRMRGVVEKCTFCSHRLLKARDKARVNGENPEGVEYTPACVEACPVDAIVFGNLHNPESEVAKLSRDKRAFRLLEKLKTEPKVYYLTSREWLRKQGDNYLDEKRKSKK